MLLLLCLQVFIAISLILGDGLYNLIKIIAITVKEMCKISTRQKDLPIFKEVLGKKCWSIIISNFTFGLFLCCLFKFFGGVN